MLRFDQLSTETFRDFDTVIIGLDAYRQHLLDRSTAITRATIDALKTVISPDHDQTATGQHVIADQPEPVADRFAFQPHIRMQQ
jgi:hypothetical protein